jgi:hypothetical protein
MRQYKFSYLHVPPRAHIDLGIDQVEMRTVTINASNRQEAKRLFDLMMDA